MGEGCWRTSPKFSSVRPKRGSVQTLISGEKPRSPPFALASAPITAPTSPTSSWSQVAPWRQGIGKMVLPEPAECSVS